MSGEFQNPAGSDTRPLALLAMRGCEELGRSVNEQLLEWRTNGDSDMLFTFPGYNKDTFLIGGTCPRFGTGEAKGVIHGTVRGHDLYILCDVTNYSETYQMYGVESHMSPDDHFSDLKRIIAAAGNKPHRVTVIMPFLYEGRQHRRNGRESLDCAIALQELFAMGVYNVITFDAHDPRVQNSVPQSNFDSVQPTYQMLKSLLATTPDICIDKEHTMVVSPDEGGASRSIYYASMMELNMGLFYKRRDYSTVINGRNPIIAHEYLGDSVEGKDIIIPDDILSTGESALDLARELKKRKAKRVFFNITFGLFTDGPDEFDRAFEQGLFDQVYCSNLSYINPAIKKRPWFTVVDMAKYISMLIATLNHDSSISHLLDPNERIRQLLRTHKAGQHCDNA